jgi:YHS domain-containing protein
MSHGLLEFAKRLQRDEAEVDMGEPARLEQDPVCGMMVDQWALQALHRGVGYAFCSQQCRERFVSAPGLYVGRKPLAPKQQGMVVMKRRRIVLAAPLTQAQFTGLNGALLSMMGVTAVRSGEQMVDSARDPQHTESESGMNDRIEVLEITYDLLQATALQLECKIVERNATLSNAWGEKLQRDFIHYLEQCELEDLAIRPPAQAGREVRTRHVACSFERTV